MNDDKKIKFVYKDPNPNDPAYIVGYTKEPLGRMNPGYVYAPYIPILTSPTSNVKLMITGHRLQKLATYDQGWIQLALDDLVGDIKKNLGIAFAYSGMADGVDLWFCQSCNIHDVGYFSCIPFEEQGEYMSDEDRKLREELIKKSMAVNKVRNSWMVERCNCAIVVWDGNKGGTHNVVQQLVEKKVNFYWINPVGEVVWKCFK